VYDGRVGEQASLTGRNLEPWRAVLSVALWLDDNGVAGLWQRMDGLSQKYQSERQEFESSDLTVLVVRALCKCLGSDVSDVSDVLPADSRTFITTSEITEAVKEVAADSEADVDIEKINTRRIGWVLKKLRLKAEKSQRNSGGTKRGWPITGAELLQLTRRYGLAGESTLSEKTSETSETSEAIEESDAYFTNGTSDADDSDIPSEDADAAFSECEDYFAEVAHEVVEQSVQMKVGEAFEYAPGKFI
jgi:translation elongation factor EF-1beta